jgi:uncharacterized protein YkwD
VAHVRVPTRAREVTESVSMTAAARFRYTLVAGATAVVIGGGFTVAGLHQHGQDAKAGLTAADTPLAAGAPQGEPGLPGDASLLNEPSSTPTIAPTSAAPSSATPRATTKAPTRPKPRRTTKAPTGSSGGSAPSTGSAIINAVLAHINAARSRAGLSGYTFSAALSKASALHNQKMINGCGLQHQCSGESGIGPRFSAQGVQWTSAGENIGFGSSGSSDSAIIQAANGLTDSMLAETPPNDGHRKNLLNSGFKRIGLSVVRDSSGKTWMTQDFVN